MWNSWYKPQTADVGTMAFESNIQRAFKVLLEGLLKLSADIRFDWRSRWRRGTVSSLTSSQMTGITDTDGPNKTLTDVESDTAPAAPTLQGISWM